MRILPGPLYLSVMALMLASDAQEAPRAVPVPMTKPVPLAEVTRITVPMNGPAGIGVGMPMFCSGDGTLFLRVITQTTDFADVVSISIDGKTIRHFEKGKMHDVPNARIGELFVTGNDLYVAVIGFQEEVPATALIPQKNGTTAQQKTMRYKGTRRYLARFKNDGTYLGAVLLEIDFRALRFGVFPTGEILVTGIKDTAEPRLALLQANGQLLRYLDPEDDVQRDSPQFKQPNQTRSPLMIPAETFGRVIASSTIMPAGNNLVLVRPGSNPRIYLVTAGGEVVRRKLEIPGDYSLMGLIATPTGWIGQFSQPAGAQGMKFRLLSFDRETGVPTHEYQYPGPFGLGLACGDGNDFLFLQEETEDSFTLVRAQPSGNPN